MDVPRLAGLNFVPFSKVNSSNNYIPFPFQVGCAKACGPELRPTTMPSSREYAKKRRALLEIFNYHIDNCRPDYSTHKLTGHMKENYHHIKSLEEFREVEEKFADAVCRFCVISFDTENKRLVENTWDGLDSYLIGTYDGSTYDFSIPDLRAEAARQDRLVYGDLATVLPCTVTHALEDRRILKLGSDAGRDAYQDEDMGISVGPVVCTQILHGLVDGISPSNDLVSGAPGTCNGLGRIAYDIYGVTHKLDVKRFEQPSAWAKHAKLQLYDWKRPLSEYARLYRALDASLPLLLLSWILRSFVDEHLVSKELVCGRFDKLLHAVAKPALAKGVQFWTKGSAQKPSRSMGKTCRTGTGTLPSVLESHDPNESRLTRKIEAEEEEEQGLSDNPEEEEQERKVVLVSEEEEEEEMIVDAVGELEVAREEEEAVDIAVESHSRPNEACLTSLDLQLTTEELAGTEDNPTEPQISIKRKTIRLRNSGAKHRSRRAKDTKFRRATRLQIEKNKYKFRPLLHRWCSYCARTTHSKRNSQNQPICPAFRKQLRKIVRQEPLETECLYRHCADPTGHRTSACSTLAGRCQRCYLRGHKERECADGKAAQEKFLEEFEKFADAHPLLCKRHNDPEWGFFYITKERQKKKKFVYSELLKCEVQNAIHMTKK